MRTTRNLLASLAAVFMVSTAMSGQDEAPGILIVRNGSDFATLAFNVYRLEDGVRAPAKAGRVGPEVVQLYTLPPGEYLATFTATNGTAALSEGRFTLGTGEEYTINFQPKGKP